jgi:hypothetical protein
MSASTSGSGVFGSATATTGYTNGLSGRSTSTTGAGVFGNAVATSGNAFGVYGVSASPSGAAVYGYNSGGGWAGYFSGPVYVSGSFSASGIKSFIQPHPNDPTKEINYIAAEGPEAMVFLRGTTRLENGKSVIKIPDYFSLIASEIGMTVQITPRSLASKGLAAYEINKEKVLVGELMDGVGSYDFDYFICAKRAGFESHEPIQPNKHFTTDRIMQDDFEKRHKGLEDSMKSNHDMLKNVDSLNNVLKNK